MKENKKNNTRSVVKTNTQNINNVENVENSINNEEAVNTKTAAANNTKTTGKNTGNPAVDTKKKNNTRLKKRLKFGFALLVIAGIIGVVIALIDFYALNPIQRSVSISMEFNYDGAVENKMPND